MGFLDELKRIARPYEDDEINGGYDDDFTPSASNDRDRGDRDSRDTRGDTRDARDSRDSRDARDDRRGNNKVVNIHTTTQLQVVLVKPEKFENASDIADHLREKRTIVMNLEQTDKIVARRLIDFLSGVAYANGGTIKKVAVSTYIITPYNVEILGDLIDELENNGLYF